MPTRTLVCVAAALSFLAGGCLEHVEPFDVPSDVTASFSLGGMQRILPSQVNCDYPTGDLMGALERITFTNGRSDQNLQIFILSPSTCDRALVGSLAPGESVELRGLEKRAPYVVTDMGESQVFSAWLYQGSGAGGASATLLP